MNGVLRPDDEEANDASSVHESRFWTRSMLISRRGYGGAWHDKLVCFAVIGFLQEEGCMSCLSRFSKRSCPILSLLGTLDTVQRDIPFILLSLFFFLTARLF